MQTEQEEIISLKQHLQELAIDHYFSAGQFKNLARDLAAQWRIETTQHPYKMKRSKENNYNAPIGFPRSYQDMIKTVADTKLELLTAQ